MTSRPTHALIVLAAVLLVAACTPRGPMRSVPEGTEPGTVVTIFEVSNRAYGAFDPPRRGRSAENAYTKFDIRVPDRHQPGNVRIPNGSANPLRHFLVASQTPFATEAAFVAGLRDTLQALPAEEREVIVFVPGYNMSEAQSLARVAQLRHDLDLGGVVALYSWPSAASPLGYGYDRDSVLYSRDAYERFLRAVVKSGARRVILVAHSMGTLLTMEVLRQISIDSPGWVVRNIGGVVLMSPDIDLEVFRSQVARIGPLPQPFAVFVSDRDRALELSARVSGNDRRLGNVTDPAELADLDIVLLDISQFASGIGHFDIGRSPALIRIVGRMAEIELSFDEDPAARAGLVSGTILTVQNATRIILSPIAN